MGVFDSHVSLKTNKINQPLQSVCLLGAINFNWLPWSSISQKEQKWFCFYGMYNLRFTSNVQVLHYWPYSWLWRYITSLNFSLNKMPTSFTFLSFKTATSPKIDQNINVHWKLSIPTSPQVLIWQRNSFDSFETGDMSMSCGITNMRWSMCQEVPGL